jgi:hypothetical protein
MKNLRPQDPRRWATKILALTHAVPFQAFNVVIVSGDVIPVTGPESIAIIDDGNCARVSEPGEAHCVFALEWVVDIQLAAELEKDLDPPLPRYAAKLQALQENGPHGPMVLTLYDGRRVCLDGPHELLLSRDGRNVAVRDYQSDLLILAAADIADLAPASPSPSPPGRVPALREKGG